MRWLGLRRQIIVLGVLPPTLIFLAFLGWITQDRLERSVARFQQTGELINQRLAADVRGPLLDRDDTEVARLALLANNDPWINRLTVNDASGRVVYRTPDRKITTPDSLADRLVTILLGQPISQSVRTEITARRQQAASPVPLEDKPHVIGWVTADLNRAAISAETRDVVNQALLAFALILLFMGLAIYMVSRSLLGLRDYRQAIRRIEHGLLDTRTEINTGGEMAELGAAINQMARRLQQRQLDLQKKVRQTTSELRETLEAVEVQNVELDLARKRALEGSKVKSEFLANMSHEIRTPINGILGFADLLSTTPLEDEQGDYVKTIKESCASLLAIVNDILDFSKIEAGKLVIDNVAFDLRDSVEEVLSLLAPTAYGKSLELVHLIYSDVPLKLYGDPIRIRQVVTNLAHNAIKFTPSGRVVVRVMLEDESEKEALLRISVTDTGIGLNENDQAKLFRAFGQADTSITRRFGGAGLGLIISKKLVEQMGGTIGLESEPGAGSTFWFTIRCLKQRIPDAGVTDGKENPLHQCRVLLYDEESLSRLAIKHVFSDWDMEITEVDDRQRFISLMTAERQWDLAVVSLTRADLNARTFHGLMPRLKHNQVPLVVLASTVDRNELRSLFQQGARVTLPKTTRRQTLYRELCRLLNQPTADDRLPLPTLETVWDEALPKTLEPEDEKPLVLDENAPKVLVVDDNEINRKLLSTILSRYGASISEAEDGKDAVDMAREQDFDLIFMDIHMPSMSGETASRRIRAQKRKGKPPLIVAVTANAMAGERERLMKTGMDNCLIKPITEEQVAHILSSVGKEISREAIQKAQQSSRNLSDDLMAMLIAELPEHRKLLKQYFRQGELSALRDCVHKLHGAARVCKVAGLSDACQTLENAIDADDRVNIPAGMDRLVAAIDQLQENAVS